MFLTPVYRLPGNRGGTEDMLTTDCTNCTTGKEITQKNLNIQGKI